MLKTTNKASLLIDDYIESLPTFSKEICFIIRKLIHQSTKNVLEDWKWNRPIFSNQSMVCGFSAHKNHVSLTFFDGANMTNKHMLFSGDCSAKNTRTIKFELATEINQNKLLDYFNEGFLMQKSVKENITNKKEIEVPELLKVALEKNNIAKRNFENMAYTYKKEYARFIQEAKRDTTKLSRLKKVITNLEQNIKMHEQYKC
jgi:hypothetical protein